jgi:hypothetical protein
MFRLRLLSPRRLSLAEVVAALRKQLTNSFTFNQATVSC